MHSRRSTTRSIAIWLALFAALAQAQNAPTVLEDFDGEEKLSTRWVAFGEINVRRIDVPDRVDHEGVEGKMARADAGKGAVLAVKQSFARPAFAQGRAVRVRLKADEVSAEKPLVIEFQVHSAVRRAWFWRKVTLDNTDWQTVTLPLRYFRQSPGAVLDWAETHRFSFYFRDAGTLSVDKIELVPGDGKQPAYLSAEEVAQFAFGDKSKMFHSDHFIVATDEPKLDGAAVVDELEKLHTMIYRDFPDLAKPQRPVLLIVFADEGAFRVFWRSLGERFNSIVPVVRSGGYSIFGLAGSYYSDEYGAVRPVYLQEACHALLGQVLGISNHSEWLHEGLANYYQLHWSQQDIHELTRSMIEQKSHVPLKKLLNGQPIGERNYAQAVLFIKWLLSDAARRKQFFASLSDMKNSSATTLEPLTKKHFGTTLEEMESAWLAWSREQLANNR